MYADFHLHSSFSSDSDTPMEQMILEGIRQGLPAMCFTEHMDFDFPPGDLDFLVDMPAYQNTFDALRQKYENQISLYFGIASSIVILYTCLCKPVPYLNSFITCYCVDYCNCRTITQIHKRIFSK